MAAPQDTYKVVINHEEQYSIWPAGGRPGDDSKPLGRGWRPAGMEGSLGKCQKWLHGVWTDMRPLSVRKEAAGTKDLPYRVVINHEEQYSIWFADKDLERGWKNTGTSGRLGRCQDYIEEVWTDMRPLSLR